MSDTESQRSERERQVDALIAAYYVAVERGDSPDPSAFVASHPEYASELEEFLADVGRLDQAAKPAARDPEATRVLQPSAASPFVPGTRIRYFGEYELLEELGVGGMGVVYKARQSKLKRIVALKLIKSGELANPQDLQRFEAEARAAARLTHPGIVPVHEVGVFQGQHFYTMDYVAGGSLARLHRDEPVASRRAAELIQQLAEAMHYAHAQGIVHRDLKPANILLNTEGIPRITDFGLAKLVHSEDDSNGVTLTETGQILGTAGYMSPEQAAGRTRLVGPPADIYALGAVLYALLTSRAPFVGESVSHTILQVLHKEPVSPRALNPSVPRDLETICLKCLEKEPHKRYGTAQLLAEDLGRFVAGRPVQARPIGSLGRGWRWCRRNPVVAGLITTVAASMLIGTGVSAYFADQSDRRANANLVLAKQEKAARELAQKRKLESDSSAALAADRQVEAEENANSSRRHLYVAHMNLAQKAWEDGQTGSLRSLLDLQQPAPGAEDLRGFEWYYWNRLCSTAIKTFQGHGTLSQRCVAFSPDGRRMACGDVDIAIRDAETGRILTLLRGHTGLVYGVTFSPDGAFVASAAGGFDNTVRLWDSEKGKELHVFSGHTAQVRDVAFSPDGSELASSGDDKTIKLWDVTQRALRKTLQGHTSGVFSLDYSPDGEHLLSSSKDQTMRLWNTETGNSVRTLVGHTAMIMSAAFSPDGLQVVSGSNDRTVRVWDLATGNETRTLTGHTHFVLSVAFSPDGAWIASAGGDKSIRIWGAHTGGDCHILRGHTATVWQLAFMPDSLQLVSCSSDNTLKVWDLDSGQESTLLQGHTRPEILCSTLSPEGDKAASGGWDKQVKLWDAVTGQELWTYAGLTDFVTCVTFSPDGRTLAAASRNHVLKLLDVETGSEIATPSDQGLTSDRTCFTSQGDRLMSVGVDRQLRFWDLRTRSLVESEGWLPASTKAVAISDDGHRLASVEAKNVIRLWDVVSGQATATFQGHPAPIVSMVLSPGGRRLATAGSDKSIRIWDCESQRLLVAIGGPDDTVNHLAFSPDGRRLAAASSDHSVKLWDVQTGQQLLTLNGHSNSVQCLAFSADGTKLISGGLDRTPRIWNAPAQIDRSQVSRPPRLSRKNLHNRALPLVRSSLGLTNVIISNDGEQAVVVGRDRMARLLHLETMQEQNAFEGHQHVVWSAAISPDGSRVATGSEDRTLRVWDARASTELHRASGAGVFGCVRFSPNGQKLWSTNWDRKVRVWSFPEFQLEREFVFESPPLELAILPGEEQFALTTESGVILLCDARTGDIIKRFVGHVQMSHGIAVVDGGQRLLTASLDRTLRLWDVETGQTVRIFHGHIAGVHRVVLLPDGKRFVSCGADRTLRLWDLNTGRELARGIAASELESLSVAPDGKTCFTAGADGALLRWDLPPE